MNEYLDRLYHYSGTEKAYSILSGKSIRLSDITRSNDKLEMNLLFPRIFDESINIYNELGFDYEFAYNGKKGEEAIIQFMSKLKNKIMSEIHNGKIATYVICFSEKEDLLSQWRGYANDGKGIALAFDTQGLINYVDKYSQFLKLEKVIYVTDDELNRIIADRAKSILRIMNMILIAIHDGDVHYSSIEEFEIQFFENIYFNFLQEISDSIKYKTKPFEEECEWRLYIDNPINKNTDMCELVNELGNNSVSNFKLTSYINKRIGFRATDNDLIPYISIGLNEFDDDIIKEIICGPSNLIRNSDLCMFLKQYGYQKCEVKKSVATYISR